MRRALLYAVGPAVASAALLLRWLRRRERALLAQVGVGEDPTPRSPPAPTDDGHPISAADRP